jgi:hypothetical protein
VPIPIGVLVLLCPGAPCQVVVRIVSVILRLLMTVSSCLCAPQDSGGYAGYEEVLKSGGKAAAPAKAAKAATKGTKKVSLWHSGSSL